MRKATINIVKRLSRRSKHQWKYVSPRRRRFSIIVLALLLLLFYAGWSITRDSFIRRRTESELEKLLVTDVDIESAELSLQDGIRLYGLRVWDQDPTTGKQFVFVYAEEVVISFSIWKSLLQARIGPEQIFCFNPVVTLVYDPKTGRPAAEKLWRKISKSQSSGTGAGAPVGKLPHVYLKQGYIRKKQEHKNKGVSVAYERLNCSILPLSDSEGRYEISVGEIVKDDKSPGGDARRPEAIVVRDRMRYVLDTSGGTIEEMKGKFHNISKLLGLLPEKVQRWLERYEPNWDHMTVEKPAGENIYRCELSGLSMKLPDEEGGVAFDDVSGTLVFRQDQVELEKITGVLKDAGGARFSLEGKYLGYKATSPFSVDIKIDDVHLPKSLGGPMQKYVKLLQEKFKPDGSADIQMSWKRDAQGKVTGGGKAFIKDSSMVYYKFPLPGENVSGTVEFSEKGVDRIDLTARRGSGRFTITGGKVRRIDGWNIYDVTVTARNATLDDTLKNAMATKYQRIWQSLSPEGKCQSAVVRVYREAPKKDRVVLIDAKLGGFASITYDKFPFTLRNLSGAVKVRGSDLVMDGVTSQDGDMTCTINGRISAIGTDTPLVNLDVSAYQVALDDKLFRVLGKSARDLLAKLRLKGMASRIAAKISRTDAESPVRYSAAVKIKDASFKPEAFPWEISGAAGDLKVTGEKITIESITGSHGDTNLVFSGSIVPGGDSTAYDVLIDAGDLRIDKKLYEVLPAQVKTIWDSLSPSGTADASLRLQSERKGSFGYRLSLDAKGMALRPTFFPYSFENVTGNAVITPGHAKLTDVRAGDARRVILVSGDVGFGRENRDVAISISGRNIPVDAEFLSAMPEKVAVINQLLKKGGEVDMEISSLKFRLPGTAETRPAAEPLVNEDNWSIEGTLVLRDAMLDLGVVPAAVTGRITGTMSSRAGKTSLKAATRINSMLIKKHRFTRLSGTLAKIPEKEVIHIRGIEGDVHRGKTSGEIDVFLADPVRYAMSTELKDVDIGSMVSVNVEKPGNIAGKLTGRLAVNVTAGKTGATRSYGELQISRGRIFKLPVIVDLLNVVFLALPGDSSFNRGFVTYSLVDNRIKFGEVYLTGTKISVLGSGSMNLKSGELDLTFITGPPGKLPRKEDLTVEILRGVSRELAEIRIKGTMKNPKIETVQLGTLKTILDRLLEPSRKSR